MSEIILASLAALTEAVFGWVISAASTSERGEKVQRLLSGDPARRAFQNSMAAAYSGLSRNYPQWTAALFDDYFLNHNPGVAQVLSRILSRESEASPEDLVELWEQQFGIAPRGSRESLLEAASYYLSVLAVECKAQGALQPFFDRRALERLHSIAESSLEQVDLLKNIQTLIREGSSRLVGLNNAHEPFDSFRFRLADKLPRRSFFVGRKNELSSVLELLHPNSRCHIVAIDGPGGVGKSSLALEAAHLCKDQGFFDLIVWTTAQERLLNEQGIEEFEPEIRVLDDVLEAVATAAGQPASDMGPAEHRDAVLRILGSTRCLIVVDNFESLRDQSIGQFLRFQMPEPSKAIVTSRNKLLTCESIGLQGMRLDEALVFVKDVVASRNPKLQEEIAEDTIRTIRDWSGGIPLAMRWLVTQRHSGRGGLRALASSLPDVRNGELLQFCFAGLYEELTTADKIVLQALTLFRYAISREALAEISEVRGEVLTEALDRLWQRCLVESQVTDERYSLLPLTRRYARQRAAGVPYLDIDMFYDRAAGYFARYCEEHSRDYADLEPDVDSILAVLSWCISKEQLTRVFDIGRNITWYLGIRGMTESRLHYAEIAAEVGVRIGRVEESMWIQAFDVGWVKLNAGRYEETQSLYADLLRGAVENGYSKVEALCYRNLALMKRRQAMEAHSEGLSSQLLSEAEQLAETSLALWLETQDEYWIAITRGTLGTIAMQQGRYGDAESQHLAAMELDRKNNNMEGIAQAKSNLGRIAGKLGHYDEALALLDEAMAIDQSLGRSHGIAAGLQRKADVYRQLGDVDRSLEMLQEAAVLYREVGSIPRFRMVQEQIELLQRRSIERNG